MKKNILLAFIISFLTINIIGQEVFHATRQMALADPNTDPNWIWYEDNNVSLYVQENSAPIVRRMPWFDNNGTAAIALNTGSNDTRDMYPSDGWVLLYRDFGTPTIAQKWPHFILYNRYKGILRLFFIDFFEATQKTYYAIKLYYKDSKTSSNISSNSKAKGYIDYYDPIYSQISICRATPLQWSYADFDLTNYDPNLPADMGFAFEVNSVLQGKIDLFADKLTNVNDASPTTFEAINSVLKQAESGIALGKQYFSTPKGFLDDMKKYADDNKGKWFEGPLRAISGSSISTAIPIIGGVLGIISGFIGDDKGVTSTFTPFKITGDVKFESPIADFFIWVPGSIHSDPAGRGMPLYDKPLGIIGLYRPEVLDDFIGKYIVYSLGSINYCVNPYADLKISDLQYGWANDKAEVVYRSETDIFAGYGSADFSGNIILKMKISSLCDPSFDATIFKTYGGLKIMGGIPYNLAIGNNMQNANLNFNIFGGDITFTDITMNNCNGYLTAGLSQTLKPNTVIKGGDVVLKIRYKNNYNKYLQNQFNCSGLYNNSLKNAVAEEGTITDNSNEEFNTIEDNNINVYPNPAHDIVNVSSRLNNNNYTIKIYDLRGIELIKNQFISKTDIDVSSLKNGIYFMVISDNNKTIRKKFVKY